MKAVHFGAGNIGRGFIGEILFENGFSIDFVDINETIIEALKARQTYTIELAEEAKRQIVVTNVNGLNNANEPEKVIAAVAGADIITTAIGPNILPFIAELIAKGLQQRKSDNKYEPLDIIACENMIGGSQFLYNEVKKYLSQDVLAYVEEWIGFPNAAVDRIVPMQQHDDPLFVSVEPFSEWVVDATQSKAKNIRLDKVAYVENLDSYIERKLFSVNTGHATTAYAGKYFGFTTIDEAIAEPKVEDKLKAVLEETGTLLVEKWNFDSDIHQSYIEKIIGRFKNPYISDDIARVARTPIRKLGYDERFIRPIREAKELGLPYGHLIETVAYILVYNDTSDEQSVTLQKMLTERPTAEVVAEITGLKDTVLVDEIVIAYEQIK